MPLIKDTRLNIKPTREHLNKMYIKTNRKKHNPANILIFWSIGDIEYLTKTILH